MPPHGKYGETRGVRWDPGEGEWILKCDECAAKQSTKYYWPLSLEFWNPRTMQRCRACDKERRARLTREKRRADAVFTNQERLRNRVYYRENKDTLRSKHTLYMREYRKARKEPVR